MTLTEQSLPRLLAFRRRTLAIFLLAGGGLVAAAGPLAAQTIYTYSGPAGGGLDTATNWTPNGIPTSTTTASDTATFNGTTAGALTLSEATANAFGGSGTLGTLISATATQTGSVTITGASIRLAGVTVASGAGALSFQNTVLFGGVDAPSTNTIMNNASNAVTLTAISPGGADALRTLDFEGTGNANITGNIASTPYIAIQKGTAGSMADGGILTLSGANVYSAGTVINAGTLAANNTSGSATGSGAVAVNSGGILGGGNGAANSGTASILGTATYKTYASGILGIVTGNTVTVASGGSIAPGKSAVGTLTIGTLTLAPGSTATYEFNLTNTTNDFTAVTGVLTLNGTSVNPTLITLGKEGTTTPFAAPGIYNLFSYGSGSVIDPAALAVADPQSGYTYTFVNDAADSLVQVDIAVPEPSPAVILLLALALCGYAVCRMKAGSATALRC
jgi:fibronectin-binding autotransporter adhesin